MINSRIILIFFTFFAFAAVASDIEIIELHKTKSLDQLVLESSNIEENIRENEENDNDQTENEVNTENLSSEVNSNQNEDLENTNNETLNQDNLSISSNDNVTVLDTETIFDLDDHIINIHLDSIKTIKSKSLHKEFVKILSTADLENSNIIDDKIYYIIKKLYEIGEIGKAYRLVKNIDKENINNTDHLNYFNLIELNYLFATFKLSEVCELKTNLLNDSAILPKFLLEKTDIFCLTLENKFSEAKLLNSVLIESESVTDENFQKLFNYMILNNENPESSGLLTGIKSKELIFLYSAMLRINELALDEDFIKIDPLNLSIPVILSESTKINIRLRAANKAYYDGVLSIDSLSALYQSVDFNSKQFSKPQETLLSLNNNADLIMAFYYQLANIQIFPDQRLEVILDYWKFAKEIGLEKIAYAITRNIIQTFNPTIKNTDFGIDIAFAHISNNNFNEASKWLNLYSDSSEVSDKIEYAKFLIDLNETNQLDTIIKYLSENYENISTFEDQRIQESFDVLINFLKINEIQKTKNGFNFIDDNRLMPSYFLLKDLKNNVDANNNLSIFLITLISINNKSWLELHPEHLNLILNSYDIYNQGYLIKPIILEILNELKIF